MKVLVGVERFQRLDECPTCGRKITQGEPSKTKYIREYMRRRRARQREAVVGERPIPNGTGSTCEST